MRRGDLGWAAAYLLLAILRLAPLSLDPAHRLADDGDALLVAWIVWWGSTHLGLGYPGIFDANAFFPHADGLLYAEPMLAQAILGWPLFRLAEPALALNLLTIATFALSAFGFHLLAREWTGSDRAALVGAVLYAFNSYTLSHIARIQLVSIGWMPLALLALHRFAVRGEWRLAVAFAALSLLHGLSCLYYLVFYALVLAVLVPPLAWRTRAWRAARPLGSLVAASAVAIAALALVAAPYAELYRRYGFVASEDPFDLVLYFTAPVDSPWYAALGAALRPPNYFVDFFLGFAALALAAAGFAAGVRDRTRTWPGPVTWIALAVLAVIAAALSAGTDVHWRGERVGTGPFAWLSTLGPFARMREPRRLAVVVVFAVALLAARGVAALLRRLPGRGGAWAAVALATLVAAEHVSPSRTTGVEVPSRATIPDVYRWLAARPGSGPVMNLPPWPLIIQRYMALDQYFSAIHGQTITTGWASFPPPALDRLLWDLRNFPDAESLRILRGLGVRLAVIHPRRWEDDRRFHLRRLAEREDVLPLQARFEERSLPIWDRYKLGGEEVRLIDRPLDDRPARACACAEIPRQAYRVRANVGTLADDAVDGSTRTRWSTVGAQHRGAWFEIAFDRGRRAARVEVEMAYPYGEFARHLRVMGEEDGAPIEMGPLHDVTYELQLLKQLVRDPREARLRYDLRPATVHRIRLEIALDEEGAPPWSLPEVHVFEEAGGAPQDTGSPASP